FSYPCPSVFIRGWIILVAASPRCAVSQDSILQDCALAGRSEHGKRSADLQSAIQQISNLRYAERMRSWSSALQSGTYLPEIRRSIRAIHGPAGITRAGGALTKAVSRR